MEAIWVAVAAITSFTLAWLLSSSNVFRKLPPGPFSLPIIGHLHLLGKRPHQSLLHLSRKFGPLMYLRLGSKPTIVVSSSEAAREFLKTNDVVFASRPKLTITEFLNYPESFGLAPYGDHWRNTRKLCTVHLLTPKQVELSAPVRDQELKHFISKLHRASLEKRVVNVGEMLSEFTYDLMCTMVMGLRFSESEASEKAREALEFKRSIYEGNYLAGGLHIGDQIPWLQWLDSSIPRMKEIHSFEDKYLQKQIDEHRARPNGGVVKDFIDVMISSKETDDLTMKVVMRDMFSAGTETSGTTMWWALSELIQNPGVMSAAREEIENLIGESGNKTIDESEVSKLKYVKAIIKETLRLHPPAPLLLPHHSSQDCKLERFDYKIPAGTTVLVNAYAIGRDETVWEEPAKFKPERFLSPTGAEVDLQGRDFKLLPFGSGRRSCPGYIQAMATMEIALASLIQKFDWRTPNDQGVDLSEGLGFVLCPAQPLNLIPVSRGLP